MRKSPSSSTSSERTILGPVTASNWVDRACSHIKAHGGEGYVIRDFGRHEGPATPAQWHAWLVYFAKIGVKTVFMRKHKLATVPCEWPEDFDLSAPISDRNHAGLPPQVHSDAHCAEMRARIAGLFRGLSAELSSRPDPHARAKPMPDARGIADVDQRSAIAAANLAHAHKLAVQYAASPTRLSDEALAHAFGS